MDFVITQYPAPETTRGVSRCARNTPQDEGREILPHLDKN
jgi:hypothetical protein